MLVWAESFDLFGNTNNWDGAGGSVNTAAALTGKFGLQINNGFVAKNVTAQATFIIGCAMQVSVLGTAARFIEIQDTGTTQVSLQCDTLGHFQFWRGNSTALLGTSTFAFTAASWHYIEVKVTIHPSAGTCELVIDGVTQLTLTGLNTRATSNSSANQILIGNNTTGSSNFYDDIYICDTTGSLNNTYLGPIKVEANTPSANGGTNNFTQNAAAWAASTVYASGGTIIDSNGNLQRNLGSSGTSKSGLHPTWATTPVGNTTVDNGVTWTLMQIAPLSNFNFVNEVPPDDNFSYLSDSTVNDKELYSFPAMTGTTVFGVLASFRGDKDDVGTRSMRLLAESGGTTVDNGTDFLMAQNTYADFTAIFEKDPNTSAAWTPSGVNGAQFGVKITA